jgi:hypothetical protein
MKTVTLSRSILTTYNLKFERKAQKLFSKLGEPVKSQFKELRPLTDVSESNDEDDIYSSKNRQLTPLALFSVPLDFKPH